MKSQSKIGIVTLPGYFNYGNKLQNYALKFVLEKMGFKVDTTIISNFKLPIQLRLKRIIKSFFKSPIKTIQKVTRAFGKKNNRTKELPEIQISRENIFKDFSNNLLNEVFLDLKISKDSSILKEYEYFVTGSDQVWNPAYYDKLPVYFLSFVASSKRIAYAPSISREEIPQEYKNAYKKWLGGMSAVSVREEAGSKIIRDLTGIDAPVLVDPTMLLTKDEWISISKRASNRPNTPYMLTYFLGGPTDDTRKKLEEIAKKEDMKIINLGDITEEDTYATGPSEFIDYINNASAFFTDSFHGVVFSIILQTPFIVFERLSLEPSMYSRIDTLLNKFDLKNREHKHFNEDVFSMDFSRTYEVLEREYEKSIDYLKKALRIEEIM